MFNTCVVLIVIHILQMRISDVPIAQDVAPPASGQTFKEALNPLDKQQPPSEDIQSVGQAVSQNVASKNPPAVNPIENHLDDGIEISNTVLQSKNNCKQHAT